MRLLLTSRQWDDLNRHIDHAYERAAFIFTSETSEGEWSAADLWLLGEDQYARSSSFELRLEESVRPDVIQHAHRNNWAAVEVHSHPWPGPDTRFSSYDLSGLSEFAPHMLWRLPNRPYIAVVMGTESFEALVWTSATHVETLEAITVGSDDYAPTGLSLAAYRAQTGPT